MIAAPQVLLSVFMQLDVAALRALRDSQFDLVQAGSGVLVSSSVNGSSFSFSVPSNLNPMQILTFAQLALDYKARGLCAPVTRTQAIFS
jgi:hypothetical protein